MQDDNNNLLKSFLRYAITFGICLILSFGLACLMGIFTPYEVLKEKTNWHIDSEETKLLFVLVNATFSSGVIVTGFGLLVLAADGGAFEMLFYGVRRFISLFQKDSRKIKFKTFYDYHVYHSTKPKTPFLYLVIVGVVFIITSLILLIVYQNKLTLN